MMKRLIGHMMTLILTGLFLAGCSYDESVRELRTNSTDPSLAITFANGLIDKPITTRAVTLLSDHMNTMGVWGWQTTPQGTVERPFIDQKVTFNVPEAKWTYTPLKYWENNSTYWFSAYAPHQNSVPGVTASIDSITHAISIGGVTLYGCNTITKGVPTPPANFGSVDDVDWMVDRFGQNMIGFNRGQVTFNMQHILSKICVRIARAKSFLQDSIEHMSLDSIKITDFVCQGNFNQSIKNDSLSILAEWTPVDTLPRYTITSAKGVSIPDSALYVIESLMIPQPVNENQYINIWYNIGNKGGYIGHYYYVIKLSDVYSRFMAGRNYVLTLTLSPDVITFDSGVSDWEDNSAEGEAFGGYKPWN